MAVWNELRVELNVGQYLDIVGTATAERHPERAHRIARYKSGKYTVERPLHLGAMLAAPDRSEQLLPALSGYGLPLGDAFQLRDDVLGAFGYTELTGKPVGDDLREGKPTPLLAIATGRATPVQAALLRRVGAPDLSDDDIAAIQGVLTETGALNELEAEIEHLAARAIEALPRAGLLPEAEQALTDLAHFVAWREK